MLGRLNYCYTHQSARSPIRTLTEICLDVVADVAIRRSNLLGANLPPTPAPRIARLVALIFYTASGLLSQERLRDQVFVHAE